MLAAPDVLDPAAPAAPPTLLTPARELSVLIVDDAPEDRLVVRRLLRRRFDRVRFDEAETAREALALARRTPPPDVLILDHNLPDATSADVLEELRVARGLLLCPTVILTSNGGEALVARLMRAGAGDYLNKTDLVGDGERGADALERAVAHAREQHRLARRADLYRRNAHLKRRRERSALEQTRLARREAEAARERLALALSAAQLGIWDWNPQTGQILTNERFDRMLGYAPGEIAATYSAWHALVHPDDLAATLGVLGDHLEGCRAEYRAEFRLRTKSGAWLWVGASGQVVARDGAGRATRVTGVHQDIDARKRAEVGLVEAKDQAERTRQRLAGILTGISDAFVVIGPDWAFGHVNPRAEHLLGRPAGELVGRPVWQALAELRGSAFEAPLRRAMTERQPTSVTALYEPLGKWIDARFYPAADGDVSAFLLDVSDLKEQERLVREGEALAQRRLRLLEDVYASAPAGLAMLDRDLHYVSCNERLARMHGLTAAELVGRRVAEVLPPEALERVRPAYERVLTDGVPQRFEITAPFAGDAGQGRGRHTYLAEYSPVRDAEGAIEGVNVVVADITDRKRAEEALRQAVQTAEAARVSAERAKQTAEQASQAKSEFLAVLSHELRTPLTPVLAGVQLLQEELADAANAVERSRIAGTPAQAELAETLSTIRRNVELEVRLIDDLLDLTRVTRGKMLLSRRDVDVNDAARNVVAICRDEAAAKGLELAVELSPEPAAVHADPARVEQVLWNLVKNAVKFTPAGGRVSVATTTLCREGKPASVVCEVRDTGVGIASDVLPRVFEAFEQGGRQITRTFGGLGLGLAISRALARAHGGTLTARSDGPGHGSSFTLTLPARAPKPAERFAPALPPLPDRRDEPPAKSADAADPAKPAPRVLLIEDHPDTSRLMTRFLRKRLKFDVACAADVAGALDVYRRGPEPHPADGPEAAGLDGEAKRAGWDLIISDIGLPDGTGLDLMRRIAADYPDHPPALALSGYGTEQDVRNSHDAGFREHLTKPVDLDQLERTVRGILA